MKKMNPPMTISGSSPVSSSPIHEVSAVGFFWYSGTVVWLPAMDACCMSRVHVAGDRVRAR